MKPIHVGDYEIGYDSIRLFLREGAGAEFFRQTPDLNCPSVYIGADNALWPQIVSRLLHEVLELTLDRLGCRFYPDQDLARNTAAWVFFLDHQKFADACAKVTELLVAALPDLNREWKEWKKRKP